jgi:type IV pilus assembly protein PilV
MKREAGFTLISILVAVVLLSMGVMAVAGTTGAVVAAHTSASTKTVALSIARGYLEEVRGREPADLTTEGAVQVDETGTPSGTGIFMRTMTVNDVARNLKEVRVTVDYPRARVPTELVTLAFVGLAQ